MSLLSLLIIAIAASTIAAICGWLYHLYDSHDRSGRRSACIIIAGLTAAVVALTVWAFLAGAALIGGIIGQFYAAGLLTVVAICIPAVALRVRHQYLSDRLALAGMIIVPAAVISWCLILGTYLLE